MLTFLSLNLIAYRKPLSGVVFLWFAVDIILVIRNVMVLQLVGNSSASYEQCFMSKK